MGARETDPRITALRSSGKKVYSFSRLDSMNTCPLGAWYTYIKNEKGVDNVYSSLGGRIHDTLEAITNGNATPDDLLPAMKDELDELDLRGIDFPKSRDGSEKIRERWIADMTYFCTHYLLPKGDFRTEELLIYDAGCNRALIGYADLIRTNKDGSVNIYDYKTSSMYTGADAVLNHGRQLLIYKMALEQAGYTVRQVAWVFLKYSDISYDLPSAKRFRKVHKTAENCRIYNALSTQVQKRMQLAKYDDLDIEIALEDFRKTGEISSLPHDIACQFKIVPYVKTYDATPELMQECRDYIHATADKFEQLQKDVQPEGLQITERNSFFCYQLCNHRDKCPVLAEFKEHAQEHAQNTNIRSTDLF